MITQVSPKVLVGLLAELPAPSGINEGIFFHASDNPTKTFLLVINPTTGVHRWDAVGGGGGTNSTLLKWGANVQAADVGHPVIGPVHTLYLADQTDAAYVLNSPLGYPVRNGGTINGFSINVSTNSSSIEIDMQVSINGTPVISITVLAGQTGAQFQATNFPLAAHDLIDVSATSPDAAGTGAMQVVAVIDMTAN